MNFISKEVFNYPYCGQKEEKHIFLSEKVVDFVVLKSGYIIYIIYNTTGPVIYTFKNKSKTLIKIVVFVIAAQFSFPERAYSVPLPVPARCLHQRLQSPPYQEVKSAPLIQQKPDKIKFNFVPSREAFPLISINSRIYLTEDIINRIKGGWQWKGSKNVVLDVFFICILAYAITNVDVADAFVNQVFDQLRQLNAPTASQPQYFGGSCPSTAIAQIPTVASDFNDMLLNWNEPSQYNFVKSAAEAEELLAEAYPGEFEIAPNKRVSDRKAANKMYHASQLGIDSGLTKENLKRLEKIGIHNYAREGHPLPSLERVKEYQLAIKNISDKSQDYSGTYASRAEKKIHSVIFNYNEDNREIATFKQDTGELITATKYSEKAFDIFLATMNLGKFES